MITRGYGALAQLGERLTGSQEVSGSIPLCSTKETSTCQGFNRLFWTVIFYILRTLDPNQEDISTAYTKIGRIYRLYFLPVDCTSYQTVSQSKSSSCDAGEGVSLAMFFPKHNASSREYQS